MKLILQFLRPYRRLCLFTILAMLLDVAGGLLVPRLTADMINIGVESGSLDYMIGKGIAMLAVTVLSGAGAPPLPSVWRKGGMPMPRNP